MVFSFGLKSDKSPIMESSLNLSLSQTLSKKKLAPLIFKDPQEQMSYFCVLLDTTLSLHNRHLALFTLISIVSFLSLVFFLTVFLN